MKKIILSLILIFITTFAVAQEKIEYDDDKTANDKEYFGWALPDTGTGTSRWKIMRITYSGNDFVVEWNNGDHEYNGEWDNRATTETYE